MSALLSSVLSKQNKLAGYTAECKSMGIRVLPPHVNYSMLGFAVSGRDIRYGLLAVKNLGRQFIDQIITERRYVPYQSFYDFCKRLHGRNMNSRALESLIKCGALDGLGANRRQMLTVCKSVLDDLDYEAKHNLNGQMSFFDMGEESQKASAGPEIPELPEFPRDELLRMENEIAGMYLSGHPVDDYQTFAQALKADRIGEIISEENRRYRDGQKVCVVGILTKVKTQLTKTNKMMSFATVEDRFGAMELIVFPNVFERCAVHLIESNVVCVKGSLSFREDEEPKMICETVDLARTNEECEQQGVPHVTEAAAVPPPAMRRGPQRLYIKIDNLNTELYRRAKRVLDIFDGRTPVIFYLSDIKKQVQAPSHMWVSLNDVMIRELKYQLGEKNVVVK